MLPSHLLLVERTADPSAALGMTKGRAALPSGLVVVTTTSQTKTTVLGTYLGKSASP
jgi:hypothetical protein